MLAIGMVGAEWLFNSLPSPEDAPQELSAAERHEDLQMIGRKKKNASQKQPGRSLAFEPLEDRRMLAFTHPGVLSTQTDLDRMEAKVAAVQSPWIDSWNILAGNTGDLLDDNPLAQVTIHAGAGGSENYIQLARDAAKSYQLALRYHGSNDTAYADKAVEILNAWATTHTGWSGDTNVSLRAGLYGYQMASAAELMRDYNGWSPADFTAFQDYMLNEFYPLNADFLTRRHGTVDTHYWANWTLSNVASMIAIGVLTDRQDIFDEGINYMYSGPGTESLDHAVTYVHPNGLGQWQESGRDQGHSLMGPQLLGVISEIAWNQGVDLYSYDNNRFLASVEYISKYNLGYDVPFGTYAREYGHPGSSIFEAHWSISSGSRGQIRPGWDLVYNHYVNRVGLAAPYTREYADMVGPEGGGFNYGGNSGGFDGLGFTTLTHSRDPIAEGAVPGALRTTTQDWQVTLSWPGSAYAESYYVKRSTTSGGPYTTIAMVGPKNLFYVDPGLTAGTTYYYVVSANNPNGESADSEEASVTALAAGPDQAELASIGGGSLPNSTHDGYNGTGYVNYSSNGGYVEYTNVRGGAGGSALLDIRYALGNTNRTGRLIVNGVSQNITVAGTGSWSSYATHTVPVTLNSGVNNTIRIDSKGQDFGNVDEITIRGISATSTDTIPAAPDNLSAAPVNSQIDLSWDPIPDADSYNVKRATAIGGPYVILNNQAGTTYSDTHLPSNTPYYYVVSALNSAGESANSSEASSTVSDLTLRFKFDETSGTVAEDYSGNGWDGTLVNGPVWTAGRIENGVSLDGTNDYVDLADGVLNGLTEFTAATWVYLDSRSDWTRIFDFGTGTSVNMFLTPKNGGDGNLRYAITTSGGGGEQRINTSYVFPLRTWTHVAVTWEGNVGILYVNGSEVGRNNSMTLNPSSLGATTQNYLGKSQYADPYLDGRLDDFRVYNRALNPAEINEVSYAPSLLGDFNLNGRVDVADLMDWQRQFGQNVPSYSGADGDGNGTVDGNDLDVWSTHYGDVSTGSTVMAESLDVGAVSVATVTDETPEVALTDNTTKQVVFTGAGELPSCSWHEQSNVFFPSGSH